MAAFGAGLAAGGEVGVGGEEVAEAVPGGEEEAVDGVHAVNPWRCSLVA